MLTEEQKQVEELRRGSYLSFRYLYDKYNHLLFGYLFELTKSRAMAQELVQDSFVKIWLNRQELDPSQSFKAYLYQVGKNRMIDEFRKRLNSPLMEEYIGHVTDPSLSHDPMQEKEDLDAFAERLNRAKKSLSARQTEIFELCKEQGYSPSEVAKLLGLSEQTVYNHLHSAMRLLQQELGVFAGLFALFFTT